MARGSHYSPPVSHRVEAATRRGSHRPHKPLDVPILLGHVADGESVAVLHDVPQGVHGAPAISPAVMKQPMKLVERKLVRGSSFMPQDPADRSRPMLTDRMV